MFAKFGFDSRTARNNQTFFLSCEGPKEAAFFQRFTSTRNRLSMNKTYKVIFSKVRGALMVCNEITSSVQKKGVKLVLLSSGLLLTSFAIANQITVSSEEAKLILVGDGATQQTAQITGQFEKGV